MISVVAVLGVLPVLPVLPVAVSVVVAGSPSDSGYFLPSLGVIPFRESRTGPGRPRKAQEGPKNPYIYRYIPRSARSAPECPGTG